MSYQEHFEQIVKDQLERVERMKNAPAAPDFASMDKVVIGAIDGDGIGPIIMDSCREILNKLLADEIADGKIEIRTIKGLTIENRVEKLQAVPDDVLAEIKECDLLLKGPTMTPGKGDNLPNIESANVKLRKELDLFANVRPVVMKKASTGCSSERTQRANMHWATEASISMTISPSISRLRQQQEPRDWRALLLSMPRTTATRTLPSLRKRTS